MTYAQPKDDIELKEPAEDAGRSMKPLSVSCGKAMSQDLIEALEEKATRSSSKRGWILNQGVIGEVIVYHSLLEHGLEPERTKDWFDATKDGTLMESSTSSRITYEVKTVFPWFLRSGFPITPNQISKVTGAGKTYIVQVPASNEDAITIWSILPKALNNYRTVKTYDGRKVCIYSFTQCQKEYIIEDENVAALLRSYNPTARKFVYDPKKHGRI